MGLVLLVRLVAMRVLPLLENLVQLVLALPKSADVDGRRLVQVRIASDVVKAVDHLSVDWGLSRQATIERLLREVVGAVKTAGKIYKNLSTDPPLPPPPPSARGARVRSDHRG